jgi:hypothetical protein
LYSLDYLSRSFWTSSRDVVKLFSEAHPIELIEDGSVETLLNAIGLKLFSFLFLLGMINLLNGQVKFIVVLVRTSTLLRLPVYQSMQERHFVFFKEVELTR